MKYIRFFSFILLVALVLPGQQPAQNATGEYVPGEMIVMLRPQTDLTQEEALSRLVSEYRASALQPLHQLSKRMKIWTVTFDENKTSGPSMLTALRSNRLVAEAQFNHYVELRESFPSDQYFDQQWNMHNTGQSGGVNDADIDGPEAWDYARGGTTALGDTIIIAIVDDGFDIAHDDIEYWKNWNEIPDNNIDDDGNGYIDDYDGWNAWSHTGNIIERSHGTHVSGIAAARGNNDMGVAGVNWHTKVMPIVGSATVESIVVEAYGYVYEMRKRYNETDGAEGAFVVSSNSSFGVNQGQPEDFPIWEAMYDSMGMVGILSAAATANANWNIDEIGDIPTAMTTDYLISVTNTTSSDLKSSSAGYGLESIDLGAPGTLVYSTNQGNSYSFKSGTSMASPHVAGAVALMYSAFDSAFLTAYHADPGQMCLEVKTLLLNAVDPLPDLEGITVTGGRLNVFNAIGTIPFFLTPNTIQVEGFADQILESSFTINNNLGADLSFEITFNDPDGWLTIIPDTGTIPPTSSTDIGVSINTGGMSAGEYDVPVTVTGNGQDMFLDVTLNVLAPLHANPGAIDEGVEAGQSRSWDILVRNISQNPVNFTTELQNTSPWMSVSPGSGMLDPGEDMILTLEVETMGIAPGNYSNNIELWYAEGVKLPIPVDINIFVPPLHISIDSLVAVLGPNETFDTSFVLTNNTDLPLLFNLQPETPALWMSYDPDQASIIPHATFTVSFSFNAIEAGEGIHENNLIIKYYDDEQKLIPVKLQVIYYGQEEIGGLEQLKVSPNPVSDRTAATFVLTRAMHLEWSLLDMSGKEVRKIDAREFGSGPNRLSIPAEGLKGVYLLKVSSGRSSTSVKLIIP